MYTTSSNLCVHVDSLIQKHTFLQPPPPTTTTREAALDSTTKESTPEEKRVKFNIEGIREADETPPPLDVDLGDARHDDVTTHHCDTGILLRT